MQMYKSMKRNEGDEMRNYKIDQFGATRKLKKSHRDTYPIMNTSRGGTRSEMNNMNLYYPKHRSSNKTRDR